MPMNMRCNILKPYNKEIEGVSDIDPIVIESVNHISGAHAALFWDILYGTSESIIALENTEAVLAFLYDGDSFAEALMLIRAYYELLRMDWPDEFVNIEQIGELKEPFLYEFLLEVPQRTSYSISSTRTKRPRQALLFHKKQSGQTIGRPLYRKDDTEHSPTVFRVKVPKRQGVDTFRGEVKPFPAIISCPITYEL